MSCKSYARHIPPALPGFYHYELNLCRVWWSAVEFEPGLAKLVLLSLHFFPNSYAFSLLLFFSPFHSQSVSSHSLCFYCFLLLCLCQTSTLHSPPLPLLLPETNSLATSCSVSQKGRVSLWCHSNPIQHQTVRHATLLTRNSQEGLLRIRLWTGRRERKREAGVLVPICWLLQYKHQKRNCTSSFDWTCMTIHILHT